MRATSARSIDMTALGEEARQHLLDPGAEAHGVAQRVALAFGGLHDAAPEGLVIDLAADRGRARGWTRAGPRVVRALAPVLAHAGGTLATRRLPRGGVLVVVVGAARSHRLVALEERARDLVDEARHLASRRAVPARGVAMAEGRGGEQHLVPRTGERDVEEPALLL